MIIKIFDEPTCNFVSVNYIASMEGFPQFLEAADFLTRITLWNKHNQHSSNDNDDDDKLAKCWNIFGSPFLPQQIGGKVRKSKH